MIKEFDSYDLPVDNENIFERISFEGGITRKEKIFQIYLGVFISPHRVTNANIEKIDGSIYNDNYVSDSKNKTEYLKSINILFKRILQVQSGKDLLI